MALVLLCLQVALPWTARSFVTQDGPSHIYGSLVTWDLVTGSHSRYAPVYRLQSELIPNSATTLILKAFCVLVGTAHAEQLLISLLFFFHLLAFGYACRGFSPGGQYLCPLATALIQTYFFTRGYYNFQIGMSACLMLVGYGTRQMRNRARRGAVILALGSAALYFTSILPLLIAVLTLVCIGCWTSHSRAKTMTWLLAALSPGILLALVYTALSIPSRIPASSGFNWRQFPTYLFRMSGGMSGVDFCVYSALGISLLIALYFMQAVEWKGVHGALALAIILIALLAVFGPDQGFGGGEVKIRMLWAAFLFGAVFISTAPIPRPLWIAINVAAAALVVYGFIQTCDVNNRANVLTQTYLSALNQIPRDSTFVRLEYPMPVSFAKAGLPGDLLFNPLVHLDSYAAAVSHSTALSDYEAASRAFPEALQPTFPNEQQWLLQLVEAAYLLPKQDLENLVRTLPVHVDYYVILGEASPIPGEGSNMTDAISVIEASGKKQILTAGDPVLVRIFH